MFLHFALENIANLHFFMYLFRDPPKMDPERGDEFLVDRGVYLKKKLIKE